MLYVQAGDKFIVTYTFNGDGLIAERLVHSMSAESAPRMARSNTHA